MLSIDPRAGSKTLIRPLRALGVPILEERLDFADVSFVGNGPEGPIPIGIEHKRVDDVLDCIKTGRFASHQLPGMRDCYAVSVLMVQGRWRADRHGNLLLQSGLRWVKPRGRKQWFYRHLAHWLHSIQFIGGVHVIQTENVQQSAAAIKALHTWWTIKEWDEHETLKVFNESGRQSIQKPTALAHMAKAIRGVGWDKAHAIAKHFKTPRRMANADEADWRCVPGVGIELAGRAVTTMTTEGVR